MTEKEIRTKFPNTEYQETIIGETPGGGAFAVIRWSLLDGTPCTKGEAKRTVITEYDSEGQKIDLIL